MPVSAGQTSLGLRESQPVQLLAPEPVDDDVFCALPRPCRYAFVGKVAAVRAVLDQHRSAANERTAYTQGAFF